MLGRLKLSSIASTEPASPPGVTRTFSYTYDVAAGTYTRTGPDAVETFVELDAADRVQFVRRGPAASPLMTATYTYYPNDLVESITYGNLASIHYTYDEANRVTVIEHRNDALGTILLRMDYAYYSNDLPAQFIEGDYLSGAWTIRGQTDFWYDRRNCSGSA